jgi:hypothetical protein
VSAEADLKGVGVSVDESGKQGLTGKSDSLGPVLRYLALLPTLGVEEYRAVVAEDVPGPGEVRQEGLGCSRLDHDVRACVRWR